jgi:hypothetical protein
VERISVDGAPYLSFGATSSRICFVRGPYHRIINAQRIPECRRPPFGRHARGNGTPARAEGKGGRGSLTTAQEVTRSRASYGTAYKLRLQIFWREAEHRFQSDVVSDELRLDPVANRPAVEIPRPINSDF